MTESQLLLNSKLSNKETQQKGMGHNNKDADNLRNQLFGQNNYIGK